MKNNLFISSFYKNDKKLDNQLLLRKDIKLSYNIKTLKQENKKEKFLYDSGLKSKVHNIIIDPLILLSPKYQDNKNIKTNFSLDNKIIYNKKPKSSIFNNKKGKKYDIKLKIIHKSNSVYNNFEFKNYKFFNNIKRNILLNPKYEYHRFLLYKKRIGNKIIEKNDELKEKYYIRGLALNKNLAFYYYQCQRVDFSEKEEKNNRNKYISIKKPSNKNKFDFKDKERKINFNNNNINNLRKKGLTLNYSIFYL